MFTDEGNFDDMFSIDELLDDRSRGDSTFRTRTGILEGFGELGVCGLLIDPDDFSSVEAALAGLVTACPVVKGEISLKLAELE